MAIAFRNFTNVNAATANITGTEPTGTTVDDIMIACLYHESSATVTPPAGWTNVFNGVTMFTSTSDEWVNIYWIRRGASAPSFTWTFALGGAAQITILSYSGALNTGDPFSFGVQAVRNDSTATTFPAVTGTTAVANEMLVWFSNNFNGVSTYTVPTGFTLRATQVPDDTGAAEKAQAVAGSTGSVTGGSWTATAGTAISSMVGLRPASTVNVGARMLMLGV